MIIFSKGYVVDVDVDVGVDVHVHDDVDDGLGEGILCDLSRGC